MSTAGHTGARIVNRRSPPGQGEADRPSADRWLLGIHPRLFATWTCGVGDFPGHPSPRESRGAPVNLSRTWIGSAQGLRNSAGSWDLPHGGSRRVWTRVPDPSEKQGFRQAGKCYLRGGETPLLLTFLDRKSRPHPWGWGTDPTKGTRTLLTCFRLSQASPLLKSIRPGRTRSPCHVYTWVFALP